jgi:hypothetical protein
MTDSGHDGFAHWFIPVFFWILFSIVFIRIFINRRKRSTRRHLDRDVIDIHDSGIADAQELQRAEEAIAKSSLEIREEILQDHALLDRFSSLHGFNEHNLEKIVEYFNLQGISATYFRQDTAPTGALTLGSSCVYEFYVRREDFARAQSLLRKYLQA